MKKKLLVVLLMICLVFGLVACKGPDTGAFNYFQEAYGDLKDETDIRLETIVYEELDAMLTTDSGKFLIFFGGSWDESSQKVIKYVNDAAIEYSVSVIYNFDPSLDGNWSVDQEYKTGMKAGTDDVKMNANLTASNTAAVSENLDTVRTRLASKLPGNTIPLGQLMYFEDGKAIDGTLSTKLTASNSDAVKASIKSVIDKSCVNGPDKSRISVVTPFYYFSHQDLGLTDAGSRVISSEKIGEKVVGQDLQGNDILEDIMKDTTESYSEFLKSPGSPFTTVTYHELMMMLKQVDDARGYNSDFLVFIGDPMSDSFKAVDVIVSDAATTWSIDKVYVFNPVLANGIDITDNFIASSPTSSSFRYTVLYADLLTALGGNYRSTWNTAANISVALSKTIYSGVYSGLEVATASTTQYNLPKMSGATLLLVNNNPPKNNARGKILAGTETEYSKSDKAAIESDESGAWAASIKTAYTNVISSHANAVEVVASSGGGGGDTSGGGGTTPADPGC